jgi:hypothetical protein
VLLALGMLGMGATAAPLKLQRDPSC